MRNLHKLIKKLFRKHIQEVISNPEKFIESDRFFTRERIWTLERVIKAIFSMQHGSLIEVLDQCLSDKNQLAPVSESAFIQQRSKVSLTAFIYIFMMVSLDISKLCPPKLYHGMYLLACDGSDFPMPTEVTPSEPGASEHRKAQHHMDHINAFFDVLNMQYVAVTTKPKLECNERHELLDLAEALPHQNSAYRPRQCIILCDRGYESYRVLMELGGMGYSFVIRSPAKIAKAIASSKGLTIPKGKGNTDITVTIKLRKEKDGTYKISAAKKWQSETDVMLSIRLVAHRLPNGEVEYLLTNIPKKKYSARQIVFLYRKRWNIETAYKYLKYGVGGIVFHAKGLEYQEMELYAALTLFNCVSAIINHITVKRNGRKYRYKINFTTGASRCITYLFMEEEPEGDLEEVLRRHQVAIQPNRQFERGRIIKKAKSFQARV